MSTFVEITKSEHNHGGPGWEFGTCLWSPTVNRSGADRYSLMREPAGGDRVLHFYRTTREAKLDTYLIGESRVATPVQTVTEMPPSPGDWAGMSPYYRIDLEDFREFDSPVTLPTLLNDYGDQIRDDLLTNGHKFYPFNTHGDSMRTVQGIYLARCPATLEAIIQKAMLLEDATVAVGDANQTHLEYRESRRLARERYFFARNAKLVQAAKKAHGFTCQACGFNFLQVYGELGSEFIEAHHLDPLSERPESEWPESLTTTIDGIATLCSNCHRMVHRRRPALSFAELKAALAK